MLEHTLVVPGLLCTMTVSLESILKIGDQEAVRRGSMRYKQAAGHRLKRLIVSSTWLLGVTVHGDTSSPHPATIGDGWFQMLSACSTLLNGKIPRA